MEESTNEKMPLISVIVPVYNAADWLGECVESILAQTYSRLEIILVDDGSTDGSDEICRMYALRDGRVRVLRQTNGGVGTARNAGLDAAAGDYIGWVDADDRIEPDMFECLLSADADLAVCAFKIFDTGTGASSIQHYGTEGVYRQPRSFEIMAQAQIGSVLWNKLSRRALWEGLRFPPCRIFDDETVFYCLLARAGSLAVCDRVLYHYHIRPRSVMRTLRPADCISALQSLYDRYTDLCMCDRTLRLYMLTGIYHIFRRSLCSMAGKPEIFKELAKETSPTAALLSEHRGELADFMKLGTLGRLEMAALLRNTYWACRFSQWCQPVYERKQRKAKKIEEKKRSERI